MSRRVFQFKCESCGTEEDVEAKLVEEARELHRTERVAQNLGEEFTKNDWTYCLSCGGVSWRMWNPPAISFNGAGFTRTGR